MTSFTIASRILVVLGAAGLGALAATGGCSSDESTSTSETSGDATGASASSGAGASGASTTASGMGGGAGMGGMGMGGAGGMGVGGKGAGGMANGGGPPDAGEDVPCVRRPFLVDGLPRAGAIAARADWSRELAEAPPLDAGTRRALAEAWLEDGRQEHASIAAFARFTMLLVAIGAPPEIVHGSQRASLDEIEHARACFGLAERYSGAARGPAGVSLAGALDRPATLAEIAALTVHEGCVGETLGVLLASEQLAGATDPAVRSVLEKIVRDEMRHAELAWRFVKWAIERGGEPVRAAVVRALAEASAETIALRFTDPEGVDLPAWRAHGRLDAAAATAVASRGLREIVAPCARALIEPGSTDVSPEARA